MEGYRNNWVVNLVIIMLIILGGLGWRVTSDLWTHRKQLNRRNLSLHTRLVLRTSFLLIVIGTIGLMVTESFSQGSFLADLSLQICLYLLIVFLIRGYCF